jgi:hypothetical protein
MAVVSGAVAPGGVAGLTRERPGFLGHEEGTVSSASVQEALKWDGEAGLWCRGAEPIRQAHAVRFEHGSQVPLCLDEVGLLLLRAELDEGSVAETPPTEDLLDRLRQRILDPSAELCELALVDVPMRDGTHLRGNAQDVVDEVRHHEGIALDELLPLRRERAFQQRLEGCGVPVLQGCFEALLPHDPLAMVGRRKDLLTETDLEPTDGLLLSLLGTQGMTSWSIANENQTYSILLRAIIQLLGGPFR